MRIAPIGLSDVRALAALGSRADVVRFGAHEPDSSPAAWIRWLGPPDPNLVLTLGAFERGRLEAALKVVPSTARRRLHGATLHLVASADPSADAALDALLTAAFDVCDRWLAVARCELTCPADHPRIGGLFAAHGLSPEGRFRASLRAPGGLGFIDEVSLGRLSSELRVPEPLATSLRIRPVTSEPGAVRIRAARASDAEALAASMSEPGVVWGTLHIPFQRPERWSERLTGNPSGRVTFLVVEVDGVVSGAGALTVPEERRRGHTGSIGMHVATRAQGRGVGRKLMNALLEDAERRGLSRVELTVYPDNERARRLYERAGFVVEGRARFASLRDGTYVDDLLMARILAP